MINYHNYTKEDLITMLELAQEHNSRLAALSPVEASNIEEVEMKLSKWTLKLNRDTCKIVRNK